MDVVYKQDIIEKIIEAQHKAKEDGKEIDHINLSLAEWEEAFRAIDGCFVTKRIHEVDGNKCIIYGTTVFCPEKDAKEPKYKPEADYGPTNSATTTI